MIMAYRIRSRENAGAGGLPLGDREPQGELPGALLMQRRLIYIRRNNIIWVEPHLLQQGKPARACAGERKPGLSAAASGGNHLNR